MLNQSDCRKKEGGVGAAGERVKEERTPAKIREEPVNMDFARPK
jgi:hypothetical protein